MNIDPTEFQAMVQKVRAGDSQSISRFVETYEPFIRRSIRMRLARASLSAVADSVDVCQSVLRSVLIRLSASEYELHSDDDLRKLLHSISNHKFVALQRRELADKRDRRRIVSLGNMTEIVDPRQRDPNETLTYHDLLTTFEKRLNSAERHLYELRRKGLSWQDIAEKTLDDAVTLRKRLSRAVQRVAVELGIDEPDDEDHQGNS